MSNMKFGLHIPTKLIFGVGELKQLSTERLPGKKALIVISGGSSMKKYGYLEKVQNLLTQSGVESVIFDKALPNPILQHVHEGVQLCIAQKCDFIVGLGGGSSIDTAKAIALAATNGGSYWRFATQQERATRKALPLIAIPTTSGTGTEIDQWSVITNEETNEKIGYGQMDMFPTVAIVDPELMVSIPPLLTAFQGFDALFHAVEGYINTKLASPISDMYALEAIRLLAKYLPVAVNDGKNIKARAKVAWASTLAGMVESTSCCTGEHALEHALSAFYPKLPHGAGLIALSHAYHKTFKNDVMKRYMKMSEKMTLKKSARPSDFLDALEQMKKDCKVDDIRLSEWGVKPEDFERLADNAIATGGGMLHFDPHFLTREEIIDIFAKSYK